MVIDGALNNPVSQYCFVFLAFLNFMSGVREDFRYNSYRC